MEACEMNKRLNRFEQLFPHLQAFSYYLLLFQCIFTTIPIIFFNIGYYRFSFSEIQALIGLITILIMPGVVNGIIFFIISKKKNVNPNKEMHELIIASYCNGILQYALFKTWLNGFDGHSIVSFTLMFLVLVGSMITGGMVYKRIHLSAQDSIGILIAFISIGIMYGSSIQNLNNILAINAVIYTLMPILVNWLEKNKNKTENKGEEPKLESYLWLPRNTKHRLQPFGIEFIQGILFIILFSELFLPLFFYELETPILVWIVLSYFIFAGLGSIIARTSNISSKVNLSIIISIILLNLAITEIFPPLNNTLFNPVLCGFALGLLLSENIRFKPFGRRLFATFSGFVFMVLFAIVLAVGGNLLIVYESIVIRGRIVLTLFFLILGLLSSLLGIPIAKIYQKKERK